VLNQIDCDEIAAFFIDLLDREPAPIIPQPSAAKGARGGAPGDYKTLQNNLFVENRLILVPLHSSTCTKGGVFLKRSRTHESSHFQAFSITRRHSS